MNKSIWLVPLVVVGIISASSFYYFGVIAQNDDVLDMRYFYWSNQITFQNSELTVNKFKWKAVIHPDGVGKRYREMKSLPKELEKVDVDIVNCGGYLASGKLNYVGKGNWEMELIPNSLAPDVAEKIQKCGSIPINGSIRDWAVAVTPINKNRKYLKTPEISLSAVFAGLPSNIQYEMNCRREEKDTLSASHGDEWIDTDGDGEIDYVSVSVTCSVQGIYCKQDSSCSKSLKLINGKWIEMAYSTPD